MIVLVTDGEARAALATVRSLAAAGHTVHVASVRPRSLAGASRHRASEAAIGDPALDPGGWARRLEAHAGSVGASLILPISEVALGTIYHFELETRLQIVCPDREAYAKAVDKYALLEFSEKQGLDVPESVLVEDASALTHLPTPFRFPVVLKPRRSRLLRDGRWESPEVRIVRDTDELRAAGRSLGPGAEVLVQEFIPGHGEGVFLLSSEGRTVARFAHRRLREKPPTGGQSVLRESIVPDPELLAGSERLLGALGWTGVAMIEFRRSPGGRTALMEVNPRLWGSLQLAVDAGVDFPSLLLAAHLGEAVTAPEARIGLRTRWLLGDLDHLLISLRRSSVRRETGAGVGGLIADFLRSFIDGTRLEVFRRDDWRPFLRELQMRWRD